jgi:hypothetical protein
MKTMNIYIYKKKKISLFSIDIKVLFFYLQVGDVAEIDQIRGQIDRSLMINWGSKCTIS